MTENSSRRRFVNAATREATLVARLSMHPDGNGGVAVIVEGSTDVELLRPMLALDGQSSIVFARSRRSALAVTRRAHELGIPVVAIIDADDDLVLRPDREFGCPVVFTDYRDLESMLFLSPAGDRLIETALRGDRVDEYLHKYGRSVKAAIIDEVAFVGALRVVNAKANLGLTFRDTRFEPSFDGERISLNQGSYAERLAASARRPIDVERLLRDARRVYDSARRETLVPGHDAMAFLELVSKGSLGTAGQHRLDAFEFALRTAFNQEYFRRTRLFERLQELSKRMGVQLVAPV